jgi:serine/threonine protein kinase
MPFLRGKSLAQLIYDSPRTLIPLPICLSIILDLAAGLSYAQQLTDSDGRPLDLIHRDVSPHNAFIEFNGYAKILDFGIAQIKKLHQSTSGTQLGKIAYMAPEQFEGTVTQQADLWSLAVTAWELLTLQPLFDADHHMKTMYQVLNADIPKLSDYRDDIPIVIEHAILSALQRDIQLRPSTIREWSQSIQNHLDQVIEMPLNKTERHQMTSQWMSDYFDLQDHIPQPEPDYTQPDSKSNSTTNNLHSTSFVHHTDEFREQKSKMNSSSFTYNEIEPNKSSDFVPSLNEVIHQSLLESNITQSIQSTLANSTKSTLVNNTKKSPNQDMNEFNLNHNIQDHRDQKLFIKSTSVHKKNYVLRALIISILCISLWYLYALLDTSNSKNPNTKIMGKTQVILGDQHKAQGMLSISSYPCEAIIYNEATKDFLGNSPLKTTLPAGMYSLLLKPSRKKKNCTPRSILVEIKEKESQIYEINLAIDHSFEE